MSKIGRALLSVAGAVTLSVAVTPAPAQAQTAGLHSYKDAWFSGGGAVHTESQSKITLSDEYSSLRNLSGVAWVVFDDENYEDRRFCLRPWETVDHLGQPQWKFNDKISSVRRLGTASCLGFPTFHSYG